MLAGRGIAQVVLVLAAVLGLNACTETQLAVHTAKAIFNAEAASAPKPAATAPDGVEIGEGGIYKVGTPYQVAGKWYYPAVDKGYNQTGIASWYGPTFHGKATANGERFDRYAMTAAHKTLPLPSLVRVTNLENGRSVILRVNDRGPFVNDRIIDVSEAGASALGFRNKGTAMVRVEVITPAQREEMAREAQAEPPVRVGQPIGAPEVIAVPVAAVQAVSLDAPEPIEQPAEQPVAVPHSKPAGVAPASVGVVQAPVQIASVTDVSANAVAASAVIVGPHIQIGSFQDEANAAQLADTLAPHGQVSVTPVTVQGRSYWRVRLGPYEDAETARLALDGLRNEGYAQAQLIQP